jgi:hypothetical protein
MHYMIFVEISIQTLDRETTLMFYDTNHYKFFDYKLWVSQITDQSLFSVFFFFEVNCEEKAVKKLGKNTNFILDVMT